MSHKKQDRPTGRRGSAFGAIAPFRERIDLALPVSLVPTAMAAEMRNGWPADLSSSDARAASSAKPARSREIAEVIGQESLGLEGALAARQFGILDLRDHHLSGTGSLPLPPGPTSGQGAPATLGYASASVELEPPMSGLDLPPPRTAVEPVPVETRTMPVRGGRHQAPEYYPFGALEPVSLDAKGQRVGPCFFIPDEDDPQRLLTAARKRHRPKVFLTRTDRQKGGRWVWRER